MPPCAVPSIPARARAASDSPRRLPRPADAAWLAAIGAVFFLSRLLYSRAGVRFNDGPLGLYWQYLDPFLLRRRLWESLLHLHGQPPLFNLYLGLALKTDRERVVFVATYLACGLAVYLGSFLLMRRLSVSPVIAFAAATWLAVGPGFVAYENWLFYSLPVAALLVGAALLFARAARTARTRDGLWFLLVVLVVCASRSLYHLVYMAAAIAMLAVAWRSLPRALRAGAAPLALLVLLYAKNAVLFGAFAASTWTGLNLARLTTERLSPAEVERLIAAGSLSPASRLPAFSRPAEYPREYFDRAPPSRVRALSWEEKTTGAANFNHAAFLAIARDLRGDAAWVIRHRPRVYLDGVAEAWSVYFRPASDLRFLGIANIAILRPAMEVYEPPRWMLSVALPLAFGFGLLAAIGGGPARGRLDRPQRALAAFLCLTIAYVALVGNAAELGENNRFRFETDPFSVCLLALGLDALGYRFARRKWFRL